MGRPRIRGEIFVEKRCENIKSPVRGDIFRAAVGTPVLQSRRSIGCPTYHHHKLAL